MRPAQYRPNQDFEIEFMGELYRPKTGLSWSTHKEGFQALIDNNRIVKSGETLGYKLYLMIIQ